MWYIVISLYRSGCGQPLSPGISGIRNFRRCWNGGRSRRSPNHEIEEECCGQHETCERDSLLAAVSKKIEYYNDEELDRFQGVEADAYDEEAIEEFSEVLYTLREVEVAGWLRSLQLRGINLPDALKDEAFLIIGERRTH